jgi:hypothetical protein
MQRYGLVQNGFVAAMILAITVGGPGSYLCLTGRGTLQVENLWSGGCLTGKGTCSTSTESPTAVAAESTCGACTDLSLHLDSSLPSEARTGVCFVLASHAAAWICNPVMQLAIETQVLKPAFPPQDSTASAIRTVVLIV